MAVHGGCACGAVRYSLSRDEPPPVYCCHCRDCQCRSGSAFTQTAFVSTTELEVTGPLFSFPTQGASGSPFDVSACAKCYSCLFTAAANMPDKLLLRAGSLDDANALVPVAHIYTSRKQSWLKLPVDVLQCEGAPTPDFFQVLGLT
jgi:hypothetical protein